MLQAVLGGTNRVAFDIDAKAVKATGFPIDWTTTNLEGAVP